MWHEAISRLVLALPQSVPVLVEGIKTGKVKADRASAFANYLSTQGLVSEAEAVLRAVVDREPNNAAHLNNLAVLLLKLGGAEQVKEAVGLLDHAVDLDYAAYKGDAINRPAFQNREIAQSVLGIVSRDLGKKKEPQPSPAGTLEALEKAIRDAQDKQAQAETLLEIAKTGLKYVLTALLGFLVPIGIFFGAAIPFNTIYAVGYGAIIAFAFALLDYFARKRQKSANFTIETKFPHFKERTNARLKIAYPE